MEANVITVNILQFANYTLLLCEPEVQNILVVKSIPRLFELASGLKVNFSKCKLEEVGV